MAIHPTAIIESGAVIDPSVEIGPYAYIGARVRLGAGCVVHHHATVDGNTQMGTGNIVSPYAFVGGKTQDLKYRGGEPGLRIGDNNTFREFCTVHCATPADGCTVIGNHNYFLSYAHIAHDCVVGNHIIMSNNGTLGGHVVVEDHAIVGGLTAIHQFCRVGQYAMIGGCAKVVQDVPPFMTAEGNPCEVRTFNKVGLERAGYTEEQIRLVRHIYKTLYRDGLNRTQAVERLKEGPDAGSTLVQAMLDFIAASQRGLC
ncbi:MAG: acyl-ACP--UDP-N-acetylglucosamine O-acyltransferase [Verrucomicrobiota bacterium]|nr:acyl-ACP--UDP-N-acetylglucosamine O-acyltransferase [Verrucomicrobiota bacterium]